MSKPVRILMLGGSPIDSERASAQLNSAGIKHQRESVQDRDAFIGKLLDSCPDLILFENSLAGLDSDAALAIAQKLCPHVPFLYVSGPSGEQAGLESLKQGATDYISKQNLERLVPAVKRALAEARERMERRQAQEELAEKARELTVLNADLQQFAYAVSHDLQEPLRTISLFSKLLSTRYRGAIDERADEYLGYIESAARHMSALLEDLLLYVRVPAQERNREPVDLNAVVDETIFLFQATLAETNGKITRDELPVVPGIRAQIGLVFQNLISNALKYHGSDPPQVHIKAVRDPGAWVVSVQDNGVGFDPRYSEQVFGLFKRLNREHPGTGLGLAICKRIVELHGGRIWVESKPNQGCTFFFSVPAGSGTPMSPGQASAPGSMYPERAIDGNR